MARSDEILAQINEKRKLKAKLEKLVEQTTKWSEDLSCLATQFSEAGALLTESVSIGGKPIDEERTSKMGQDFSTISEDIVAVNKNMIAKIAELEDEIASLEMEYIAALTEEIKEKNNMIISEV